MTQNYIAPNIMLKAIPACLDPSLTAWPGAVIFIALDGICFHYQSRDFLPRHLEVQPHLHNVLLCN